ncbi:MAG: hypothetical protein KDA92_08240 [Planctomycetales bacterium]|nr:hypothetical protein [Planctomycetales bacterium]
MINSNYLYTGLCGLANAYRAGTMAGHLGAAVVAGFFWSEDVQLAAEVERGVEGELERIKRGEEAIWFDAKKAGVTPQQLFAAPAQVDATTAEVASLADELSKNGPKLIESGHNTIFASIAIRALTKHPEHAKPEIVAGIRSLIAAFTNAYPGRGYYGKARGWQDGDKVELPADDGFPVYRNLQELADTTIAELIATASMRRRGFGGLWHVINHAAAIVELDRLGYQDLAARSLPAHHHHIRLWRSLPDVSDEFDQPVKSEHDPLEPVYWQGQLERDQAKLTHRIKTLYGFNTLSQLIADDATLMQAKDALLYLMD